MSATQLKTIIPGVVMRTGTNIRSIRFSCMVRGSRFTMTYTDLPVEMLVDCKGRPTRELRDAYTAWKTSKEEEIGVVGKYGRREPTIGQMIDAWEKFATKRSVDPRYMRPTESSIRLVLLCFRYCYEQAGLSRDDNYTKLVNEKTLREVFDGFVEKGLAGITAWNYVTSIGSITAKWTEPYWENLGYIVRRCRMPDAGLAKDPPRYRRPSQDLLDKQDLFYASLQDLDDKQPFLVATMALQFAMRPVDIGRLTADNFVRGQDGCMYLSYTPQKTMHSSKRIVTWKIPESVWGAIREYAGERLDAGETMISSIRYVVANKINPAMRKFCGMEDSTMALYEYRKRCIDYVYHHYGINAAVAISGDSAQTIEYHYFDPTMTTMAPTFMTVPIKPVESSAAKEDEKDEITVA